MEKGRFPWDLVRMRIVTNSNEETEALTTYLMENYQCVLLSNSGRMKNLDTDSPYRATHFGLVGKNGVIAEVEMMPYWMK